MLLLSSLNVPATSKFEPTEKALFVSPKASESANGSTRPRNASSSGLELLDGIKPDALPSSLLSSTKPNADPNSGTPPPTPPGVENNDNESELLLVITLLELEGAEDFSFSEVTASSSRFTSTPSCLEGEKAAGVGKISSSYL